MIFLFLLFSLYLIETESLTICSFNVRSFGEAKCAKPEVMALIVKIVSRCDLMLLMEIKDNKDKAIHSLMDLLNSQTEMKDEYSLIISKRLGRNTYKEQYAFIYRNQLVSVKETYQYHDMQPGDPDAFSREPFIVWFKAPKTEVKEFVIIPQHTTPEAAVREIDELYDVHLDVKEKWKSENFIFMGDFNAGCSYVPKKHWKNIRLRSNPEFIWLIGDNDDTTIKSTTNCAYDRIVVHGDKMMKSIVPDSASVFDFIKEFGLTETQALEVSDHFPVQVQIKKAKNFVDKTKSFFKKIKDKISGK
ncbi:deoxyribonuclease gamma [Pelobates cultripes]|uniref:Deoxyribonuclease n=1 Tax=Pelobates cultripes TaxID=61616 RepID=A0AAD1T1V8_PELCU|nr:deoxyribonuclease gamma [Pelobates cultripes]